jgi:putative hydrolase of the HAD superfamily
MSKIKNIILDFGGVIIDLDLDKTHYEFQKLGVNHISEQLKKDIFDFEAGLISETQIKNSFKKEISHSIDDNTFIEAWSALLLDLPQERVDFLYELKKQYPLFLLSNTNSIHIDFLRKRENGKFDKFENSFSKIFYSYEMSCRKPDSIIFQKVIDDLSINPKETLFVDDTIDNINTAKKLGFQTWHFDVEKDEITKILELDLFNNFQPKKT